MESLSDPGAVSLALKLLVPGVVMIVVHDLFVPGERRNWCIGPGSLDTSYRYEIFETSSPSTLWSVEP